MICYVLVMGKQHLRPHVVVGYSTKIFWPGLFIMPPDHLAGFLGTYPPLATWTLKFILRFHAAI